MSVSDIVLDHYIHGGVSSKGALLFSIDKYPRSGCLTCEPYSTGIARYRTAVSTHCHTLWILGANMKPNPLFKTFPSLPPLPPSLPSLPPSPPSLPPSLPPSQWLLPRYLRNAGLATSLPRPLCLLLSRNGGHLCLAHASRRHAQEHPPFSHVLLRHDASRAHPKPVFKGHLYD